MVWRERRKKPATVWGSWLQEDWLGIVVVGMDRLGELVWRGCSLYPYRARQDWSASWSASCQIRIASWRVSPGKALVILVKASSKIGSSDRPIDSGGRYPIVGRCIPRRS